MNQPNQQHNYNLIKLFINFRIPFIALNVSIILCKLLSIQIVIQDSFGRCQNYLD